jgi:hypothetical protein
MDKLPDYCRQIESYLCQKNGGHLVRIVGPAFDTVRGWADQGVPLKVAFRGIDRCVARASAKGGRRRPLRIEFCEPDVLDAFDDWRRAIGASASHVAETGASAEEWGHTSRKGSLAAHLQRSLSRLLVVNPGRQDAAFETAIIRVTEELDALAAMSKSARGEARARAIARLAELDAELIAAARGAVSDEMAAALRREADAELSGFASRMPAESLARARELAFERLVRDALNLPVIAYE